MFFSLLKIALELLRTKIAPLAIVSFSDRLHTLSSYVFDLFYKFFWKNFCFSITFFFHFQFHHSLMMITDASELRSTIESKLPLHSLTNAARNRLLSNQNGKVCQVRFFFRCVF